MSLFDPTPGSSLILPASDATLARVPSTGGRSPLDDEGFAEAVPEGGYAWWYVDAASDDGQWALSAIFFIGSVFSPSYAARVRRGERVLPEEHLGVNLAVYHRGRPVLWTMSEYGSRALIERSPGRLAIARSSFERHPDGRITLRIDDRTAPFMASLAGVGSRVRGLLELEPLCAPIPTVMLADASSGHQWRVPVPRARIRVSLSQPDVSFEGTAYHDANRGERRLEENLSRWSWSRFHEDDRVVVLYAVVDRAGRRHSVLVDARDGAPAVERLPQLVAPGAFADVSESQSVGWGLRMPERVSVDRGRMAARRLRLLDVAPFYARYEAILEEEGRPSLRGIGEHLDLDRFRHPGLQFLLRFKTRRSLRG